MPTLFQITDPATGTLQYELLQQKVIALNYLNLSIDLLYIIFSVILMIKIFTWRNRITEIWNNIVLRK